MLQEENERTNRKYVDKIDRYVTTSSTTLENRCRFISYCSDRRIELITAGWSVRRRKVSPDDTLLMDQSVPRLHLTYGTKSRETNALFMVFGFLGQQLVGKLGSGLLSGRGLGTTAPP
jgi:hypothetical protein